MIPELKYFKILKMEARTLSWWRSKRNLIDIEPSYQRKGRRWSISDKRYLIDSILNGFDVPKLYFVDFTWGSSSLNEKNVDYAVVDGKQRLEAIFGFFDDKFNLARDFRLISRPDIDISGMHYSKIKLLYPEIAEIFDNFNPDVVTVITKHREYIEELFLRLNRSKPLSGAEVRNAIPGDASELIRRIRSHEFFSSNIRFNVNKGQDLNCAAKILMFEVGGSPRQETKKSNLDRFAKNNAVISSAVEAEERILKTLDAMSEVFQFQDALLKSEGAVPVYYWLFRNAEPEKVFYIRDFLEEFTSSLNDESNGFVSVKDRESYVFASRSINDKGSHEARYEILNRYFDSWVQIKD
ncbi:DUF262 domain-containing protein [Metapseudomonas otitidis]|uniref:DUF262 domain-containing protein n=1 Tax=Metapseudomonas otitidis TaxID=319939 RepID=UPI0025403B2D|nr:DUF262 domain-containing protein [Pseudomonas otitidis]WIF66767.1 DUF262 domain-containing protein [Pseudomonas otitidis]